LLHARFRAGDAERWRRLEAEALTVAASMTDLEPRRVMHSIAEAYRRLAERAEMHKLTSNQRAFANTASTEEGCLRGVGMRRRGYTNIGRETSRALASVC
jgi:hypothetical protein